MIRSANYLWKGGKWISANPSQVLKPQLILVFGERLKMEESQEYLDQLDGMFPGAQVVSCSTSGVILNENVVDDAIIATVISFEHTTLRIKAVNIGTADESYSAGEHLAKQLLADDLAGVFIISDGQVVNGSRLVKGVYDLFWANNKRIPVSGGLAGDGARFQKTLVGYNGPPQVNQVVAVGLYGDRIRIGNGSIGGWDPFGVPRQVTRSDKNVLYELDGRNALSLYKEYLGELAAELPSSALLFPLEMMVNGGNKSVVRTVLSVSETDQSMTFAGDIPEGSKVQLMRANFDRLIEGAGRSAENALLNLHDQAQFALLISCVGRKLILGQRVEDEVEEAVKALGPDCTVSGFYSYGEISPLHDVDHSCELHNQTMTITVFSEV